LNIWSIIVIIVVEIVSQYVWIELINIVFALVLNLDNEFEMFNFICRTQ